MICPTCKKEAPWVDNALKYGKRFGKSYMCYWCKDCNTYVGCHNNTRIPLGTMADKYTMGLRKEAHAVFDKLWKSGKMSRKHAYKKLSELMGKETHIGESDAETCKKIINLILKEKI